MFERMDDDTRQRLATAAEEATRRGDGRIGTEHLLLALLHDPGSVSAQVIGADLGQARAALDALDRAALAAVGIQAGAAGAAGSPPAPVRTRRRPPFSSGTRAVIVRALAEAQAARDRRIQQRHLLLGVLACVRPDPAAELLDALGVDVAAARARISGGAAG
jgi:ATP-dependent Clp protease ATP-binding subunit ClpA